MRREGSNNEAQKGERDYENGVETKRAKGEGE
jgi:hypothetical protein